MTDNKYFKAFTRVFAMTLALIMVLGAVMTQTASAFNGKVGSKYTVHWYKELHYGPGEGGYSNAAKCDLGDDLGSRFSICVQPNKSSPVWSGDQTRTVQVDKVVTDATDTGKWNALRNIVYYSPSYPGFKKNIEGIKQFYYGDEAKDYGVAHLALAYVYAGRPNDMATWGGTHASDCGEVWTRAKALANALYDTNADFDEAVPESFKIFICYMDGVQDMIVGYLEAPGYLNMKKVSNRTSITEGNNCYSLEGAEYTVYDKNGGVAGRMYTDANGESNTIELMEGTYTVKETYAPPGYAKDTETYTVKIESEETTTFTAKDEPTFDASKMDKNGADRYYGANAGTAEVVESKLKEMDAEYLVLESDISNEDAVKEIYSTVLEKYGRVDILLNNAATDDETGHDTIETITQTVIDDTFAVNVRGSILMIREFVKHRGDYGRIINISTDAAQIFAGQITYGASKATLEALTRSIALEVAPYGITVNCVSPGPTQTGWIDEDFEKVVIPLIPMGKLIQPDDIAETILFLASKLARMITGQVIKVSGGKAL